MGDTALGQILEIDEKTLGNIGEVSKNIDKIAKSSDEAYNAFHAAFEKMTLDATGLNEILVKIKENLKESGIDMSGITKPLEDAEREADKAAKAITDAIRSIAEFDVSNSSIAQIKAQIRSIESVLTKRKGVADPLEEKQLVNYLDKLKEVYKEKMTSEEKASKLAEKETEKRTKAASRETDAVLVEIEKQRTAYLKLVEQRDKAEEKGYSKPSATADQQKLYSKLTSQVDEAEKSLTALESKYAKLSAVGKEAFDTKKIQQAVEHQNRLAAAAEREAKEREKSYRAAERNRKALNKEYKKRLKEQRSTYEGSLDYAKQVKTFNERAQAIKYLETAMKNLDSTDSNYRNKLSELSAAHKKLTEEQKTAAQAMGLFKQQSEQVASVANKLKPILATLFSAKAITGFVKKLIEVRGELELQNVALTSILANKEKADAIFSQITQLAVKSPFTIRQLTTYTKQLAAYQVEFKKLFPVTKQLADVAAGLGVDMGRLILAYGQVKSANYLRATEVRQFTEAGINILGELSKYFTELEGRMVSVADVQERITKRMVEFGDVEEIFKRITDAGGLFYQMQERQAETLRGMWMNLQDRIDLMLNEIGKSTDKYLKGAIGLLTYLMDHYKDLLQIIKDVGIGYGTYLFTATKAYRITVEYLKAMKDKDILTGTLGVHFFNLKNSIITAGKSLGKFVASNWQLMAVIAAISAAVSIYKHIKERNDALNESQQKTINNLAGLRKITNEYDNLRKATDGAADSQDNYNKKFAQLSQLSQLMEDAGFNTLFKKDTEGLIIPVKLEEITKENIDEILDVSADVLQRATILGEEIRNALIKGLTGAEGNVFGLRLFGDNLQTDAEQLGKAYADIMGGAASQRLSDFTNRLLLESDKLSGNYKEIADEIAAGAKETETEAEWRRRELELINKIINSSEISNELFKQGSNIVSKYFKDIVESESEFDYEIHKVIKSLAEEYDGIDGLIRYAQENPLEIRTAIHKELADQQWGEIERDFAKRVFYSELHLTPVIDSPEQETLAGYGKIIDEIQQSSGLKIFQDSELKKIKSLVDASELLNKKLSETRGDLEKIAGSTFEFEEGSKDAALEAGNLEKIISTIVNILSALKLPDTTKQAKKDVKEALKERIDLLKKIRQEYEQNRKVMGEDEANAFTKNQFKDNEVFKQLQEMGVIDATLNVDSTGLITALQRLAAQSGESAKKEIEAMIATLNNEQVIISINANMEGVKNEIEGLFNRLDLTKEMEKLGLDKALTEQIFGFKTIDTKELRKQLEIIKEEYSKANSGIGVEQQKYFAEIEKKITDIEKKELQERLKNYANYLKMEASAAVRAKLEEAQELAKLDATQGLSEPQKEVIRTRIKEETQTKVDKAQWEQFKNTDMYIRMFEDLENTSTAALTSMENKLSELRSSLGNLDPQNIKEIERQLQKIQDIKMERSPFSYLISSLKEINSLRKQGLTPDILQAQIESSQIQADNAQREIDNIEYVIGLQEKNNVVAAQQYLIDTGRYDLLSMNTDQLREQLAIQKNLKNESEEAYENASNNLDVYTDAGKSMKVYTRAVSQFCNQVTDLFGEANELVEQVTGESSLVLDVFGDIVGTIGESIESVGQLSVAFVAMGVALDSALGIIGLILIAIKAVLAVVTSIIKANDEKLKAQIEDSENRVEKLKMRYEELEKAINDAYDVGKLKAYNKEMENLLKLERIENSKQIASYKDMKNGSDKYAAEIEELTQRNIEINDILRENLDNLTAKMGGFGSQSNITSAAEGFVDAWYDAFKETGYGLDALQEKFNELQDNLISRQILARVADATLEPIMKEMDKALQEKSEGGMNLTKSELRSIRDVYQQYSELFNQEAKALMEELGIRPGAEDMGGLSGLAEDYGQMTEATATVLASINESIRFFESDSNAVLHTIQNIMSVPGENPFYKVMLEQARYTKEIRDVILSMRYVSGTVTGLNVRMV